MYTRTHARMHARTHAPTHACTHASTLLIAVEPFAKATSVRKGLYKLSYMNMHITTEITASYIWAVPKFLLQKTYELVTVVLYLYQHAIPADMRATMH